METHRASYRDHMWENIQMEMEKLAAEEGQLLDERAEDEQRARCNASGERNDQWQKWSWNSWRGGQWSDEDCEDKWWWSWSHVGANASSGWREGQWKEGAWEDDNASVAFPEDYVTDANKNRDPSPEPMKPRYWCPACEHGFVKWSQCKQHIFAKGNNRCKEKVIGVNDARKEESLQHWCKNILPKFQFQ